MFDVRDDGSRKSILWLANWSSHNEYHWKTHHADSNMTQPGVSMHWSSVMVLPKKCWSWSTTLQFGWKLESVFYIVVFSTLVVNKVYFSKLLVELSFSLFFINIRIRYTNLYWFLFPYIWLDKMCSCEKFYIKIPEESLLENLQLEEFEGWRFGVQKQKK